MRTIFPTGPEGLGDAALISAARDGDVDAYAELSARHDGAARRLAGVLAPAAEVEALVTEALAKVLLVLQRGEGPDLAFRPYLLTAVRRLHVDHGAAAAPAAKEPAATPDTAAAARAFTSLAEPWRMVLWHTEIEEQRPEDVAVLLGESPDAVPALVTRAREGMRIALLTTRDNATAGKECEWTRHILGAYVRKVSFDRDTARVEQHLSSCESCAAICLELTEGGADLRGIVAPLVLGSATAAYLASTGPEGVTHRTIAPGLRARAGAAAAVGSAGALVGRARSAVTVPAGRLGGYAGSQVDRARDFVATRTAAAAVGGVAALALLATGAFVVVQTADGPPQASAEAPLGLILDDDPTIADLPAEDLTDDGADDALGTDIGSATASRRPGGASAAPSGAASPSEAATPSVDPSGIPTLPTLPGRPSEQPTQPGPPPSEPTRSPNQPPAPTQPPTQTPPEPAPPPTPPMDMGVSVSTRNLAGMLWSITVRVTGLRPGATATMVVQTSSGSVTMDDRCSGGRCPVTQTPTTYEFNSTTFLARAKTVTFTVSPDGEADANTGDNSASTTLR